MPTIARAQVVVLGDGYSGLLLATLLHRRGIHTMIVPGRANDSGLIEIRGRTISALPVFPVQGSWLTTELDLKQEPRLAIEFYGQEEPPSVFPMREDSFSKFSLTHSGPRAWVLGRKLFGPDLIQRRLGELQDKVMRHYPDGQPLDQRIGFTEGKSPYWISIEENDTLHRVSGVLEDLDLAKRQLVAGGISVQYRVLVATSPFATLAELISPSIRSHSVGAPARLVYCLSTVPLLTNRIVYDLRLASPVYRAFTPQTDVVAIQTSYDALQADPLCIGRAAEPLLHLDSSSLTPLAERRYTTSYPLDLDPSSAREDLMATAAQFDVIPFGRMALWRYVDLHELNWSIIDEIAEHL